MFQMTHGTKSLVIPHTTVARRSQVNYVTLLYIYTTHYKSDRERERARRPNAFCL